MESDAKAIIKKLSLGWNLGNSLEAYYDECTDTETSWGNPKVTENMIKVVKAAGFKAIRIPVRWYPHVNSESDFTVKESWMSRVKEVVDYCINNELYVILNTHHEDWLENHALYSDSAKIHKKEVTLWKQIASTFRNYDEHLLFAGTNEVHITDNWNAPTTENAKVQNLFNQWFIDAVRATGGKNVYRILIIQAYAANPSYGIKTLTIPKDVTPNKLAIEYHFYDPYEYCIADDVKYWGNNYKEYGISDWGQESHMDNIFLQLKNEFTDKGYPIILGEFGVVNHTYTESQKEAGIRCRAAYLKQIVSKAHSIGAAPFIWDNGSTSTGKECFGYFDRKNNMKATDNTAIDALIEGAKTQYPF